MVLRIFKIAKPGVPFLVESSKIENATFPYKTALSEANDNTNRIGECKMELSQRTKFC